MPPATMTRTTAAPTLDEVSSHSVANSGEQRKVVVVQSGARDAYQLALALSQNNMLEALVTDLFWPLDTSWAERLTKLLPNKLRLLLLQRSERRIPWSQIRLRAFSGLATLLLEKLPRVPLSLRRKVMRGTDATLGRAAGTLARKKNALLVSYSYYGYDAFEAYQRPGILFQLHPHPASMRRILRAELEAHPDCADSLCQEWELALPEEDFRHLVRETEMASEFLVASSFTKSTLVEHGAAPESIKVVPYGVDTNRFHPAASIRSSDEKLRLLFVGRINQRKGIKYLLEALRLVDDARVELTVCGRVVDGLELFKPFASQVKVRPSVSASELVLAYQSADLFVFPSVAEGFGQVLLESLACGLPVLSTTHTAAPDLIEDSVQGFIVEPRRPDLLGSRIAWALNHRAELADMRAAARARAELFTWEKFRAGIVDGVRGFSESSAVRSVSRRSNDV
jgi:glycosyltransferase involved in cell wall biosynthesis